jgi:hypothetical protein
VLTFCWTQSDNLQPLFFFSPYKLFFPFSCHQIWKKLKISVLKTSCVNLNIFSFFDFFFKFQHHKIEKKKKPFRQPSIYSIVPEKNCHIWKEKRGILGEFLGEFFLV